MEQEVTQRALIKYARSLLRGGVAKKAYNCVQGKGVCLALVCAESVQVGGGSKKAQNAYFESMMSTLVLFQVPSKLELSMEQHH